MALTHDTDTIILTLIRHQNIDRVGYGLHDTVVDDR